MKILIFAENNLLYYLLVSMLKSSGMVEKVVQVNSFELLIEHLSTGGYDIIICDMTANILRNIEYCLAVKSDFKNIKIIYLADHFDHDLIRALLTYDPDGIFFQNDDYETIFEGLKKIYQNEKSYTESVKKINLKLRENDPVSRLFNLTNREKQILSKISAGLNNSQIAESLNISEETVKTHRKNIREKLQIENYESLMKFIIDHKKYFDS